MTGVIAVTEATFACEVGDRAGLVLIDLWAPWCAPCRALAPMLADLADDFAGVVTVAKIDIDAEAGLRARLAAASVPTLVLYRDGREVDRRVGVQSRARLAAWLEAHR